MTKDITKKTLGRRKIDIKRIENKSSLQVTFSKRRMGLFKKAGELTVLTGAQIGVLVQSPSDKLFTFGTPDFESVFNRFESGVGNLDSSSDNRCRLEYEEVVRQLELEKKRMKELDVANGICWWDCAFEGMDVLEMQDFVTALEGLSGRLLNRADEIAQLGGACNVGELADSNLSVQVLNRADDIAQFGGCNVVEFADSNLVVQGADYIQGMEDQKLNGVFDQNWNSSGAESNLQLLGFPDELVNFSMENVDYGSGIFQETELLDIDELLNC